MRVKGFSLGEILVTIAILGLLSSFAVPTFFEYLLKSKLSKGSTMLNTCRKQIEAYYHEYDDYPDRVCGVQDGGTKTMSSAGLSNMSYAKTTNQALLGVTFDSSVVSEAESDARTIYTRIFWDNTAKTLQYKCGKKLGGMPIEYLDLLPSGCRSRDVDS